MSPTVRPGQRLRDAYARFVEPRASGLPNWRVVTWFPALIALGAVVLIALHISGTSSGVHWLLLETGADPHVLLGGPRHIRSDEWLVSQSWVISQVEQGFPAVNGTFPGGMDATVLMEMPSLDWSTLLRPHLWGYLLFGTEVGVAWQWWIPAIGLVSGAYLLFVTLAPRRSITAAVVACAVFFSPMFQWWYGPNQIWPTAWAFLAMAAVVWALRDDRRWTRIVWAVVVGWLATTAAIGLYVPFLVPPVLLFVFFTIGAIGWFRPLTLARLGELVRRLLPLLIAAVLAGAALVSWYLTRAATFAAIGATVYPGERSDPTGQLWTQDGSFVGIGGAVVGQSFRSSSPNVLGPNPSEAASALLFAVFVAPVLVALVVRGIRRDRRVDWLSVGALVALAVVLAYLLIPGWDPVARLLLLDRIPVSRMRMAFAAMMPLFFALIVREVDARPLRRPWVLGAVAGGLAALGSLAVVIRVAVVEPVTLDESPLWPLVAVALVAACALVTSSRTVIAAAVALLVASAAIGAAVNPLYRGVVDLNDTRIGSAVNAIDDAEPGAWVGVGDAEVMALVMQTGVDGYNGVQTYPSQEMWEQIDPDGEYEDAWNRLAHVRWEFGSGEPVVVNPARDMIVVSFDACSEFAQQYVEYVLADVEPTDDSCLAVLDDEEQGTEDFRIYRVVAPRGSVEPMTEPVP